MTPIILPSFTKSARRILLACLAGFFVAAGHGLSAADAAPAEPAADSGWNVRVEVLMVAMPEEKFITLLPQMQDEAKIADMVPQLLDAVKKKEMILKGFPVIIGRSGQRVVSETIQEKRYPTQYTMPADGKDAAPVPTAFETRNTGATLEVEPVVRDSGAWIDLNIVPQNVELLGFDSYSTVKKHATPLKDEDAKYAVDQPLFFTMKTTTSLSLRNGQYILLATHKLVKPDGYVEIFILHAVANAVK